MSEKTETGSAFSHSHGSHGDIVGREGYDPTLHYMNLYDQNEDAAGQTIDEATGEPIDNSTDRLTTIHRIAKLTHSQIVDEEEDPALQWLAKHDPDYHKNKNLYS